MFEKLPETMQIDMADLPHIDIMPPRRTFWDFVPVKVKGYLREKRNFPNYTKRELWLVYSWLLRVMANKLLIQASTKKEDFYQHTGRDYEPGKGGWN